MRILAAAALPLVLAAAVSVPEAQAAAHAVVLTDGTTLAAKTRPVMAMGEVSYVAVDGSLRNLDLHHVDVAATRAANGAKRSSAPRVWTARELEKAAGRVQVVGSVEAPDPEAPLSDHEQIARVQARIQELEDSLDGLAADDPEAKAILRMHRQLQSEVQRLQRQANRGTGGANRAAAATRSHDARG